MWTGFEMQIIIKIAAGNGVGKILVGKWVFWTCMIMLLSTYGYVSNVWIWNNVGEGKVYCQPQRFQP